MSKLISVASQAAVTTRILGATASALDPFQGGLQAILQHFLSFESRHKSGPSGYVVIENNWRYWVLIAVGDSRTEVIGRNFEHFGCSFDDGVRERERKGNNVRSVLWGGVELQLEYIGLELVAEGDLLQRPPAILALWCFVGGLLEASESGSTSAAQIKTFPAQTFAQNCHQPGRGFSDCD